MYFLWHLQEQAHIVCSALSGLERLCRGQKFEFVGISELFGVKVGDLSRWPA